MDAEEKLEYEIKSGIYEDYINYLKHIEYAKANIARGVNTELVGTTDS